MRSLSVSSLHSGLVYLEVCMYNYAGSHYGCIFERAEKEVSRLGPFVCQPTGL